MIGLTLEKMGDNDGPLDDKNVQSKDINILYQGLQSLAAILLEKEKIKFILRLFSGTDFFKCFFFGRFRTVLMQDRVTESVESGERAKQNQRRQRAISTSGLEN